MASNLNNSINILIKALISNSSQDKDQIQKQIDKLAKQIKMNISPKIDFSKDSLEKFQLELERLAKKIKINLIIGIDKNSVKSAQDTVNDAAKKINKNSNNIKLKVFDKDKLDAEGRQFFMSTSDIVNRVKKQFASMGEVNVSFLKNEKQQITGFIAEVQKASGQIEKLKFDMAKIKSGQGSTRGYVFDSATLIDKNLGTNLQNTLNKLDQFKNKLEQIKTSFSSSTTGITSSTALNDLNNNYGKIVQKIDQVKNSQSYLTSEQKREISKQIIELKRLENAYRNIQNVQKLQGKQQITTVTDVAGVTRLQQSLEKLQQKYTSIKTGIKDPLNLQTLNAQFSQITTKITDLQSKTSQGLINKADLIVAKTEIGQLIHNVDLLGRKYKDLQSLGAGRNPLNMKDIDLQIQRVNNELAKMKVNKDKVFADPRVVAETTKLQQMAQAFRAGTITSKEYALQMDNVKTKVAQVSGEFKNTNKDGYSLIQMLELATKKFVLWGVSTTVVMQALHKVQEAFQFVGEANKAFTNLQMEMTDAGLVFKDVTNTAIEYAKALTTTTDTTLKAMSVFSTYTSKWDEVLEKSKAAIILSNITGQNIEQMSDALMGTMAQYRLASEESMRVADVITGTARMLSIDYPKAVQEISDGLRTVGAVAYESKLSIEELSSILGTVQQNTRRTGTEVANALKTIFSRMGRVGEESDPEAFKGIEKAFYDIGVVLKENEDTIRPMGDILADLARRWKTLTDVEKNNIAELSAGVYRRNYFIAMMNSYDEVLTNVEAAYNSQGVAMEKQGIYADSLDAKIKGLITAWESLYLSVVNSDAWKSALAGITSVVNAVTWLTKNIGFIPTALTAAMTALVAFNSKVAAINFTPILGVFGNVQGLGISGGFFATLFKNMANFKTRYTDIMQNNIRLNQYFASSTVASTSVAGVAFQALTGKTIAQTAATIAATTATIAFNAALTLGLSVAITAVITGITSWISHIKNAKKEQQELIITTISNTENLKTQQKELNKLSSEYNTLKQKETATTEDKQRLLEIQKELVAQYGVTASGINSEGEAYADSALAIKLRNDELQREINLNEKQLESQVKVSDDKDISDIEKNLKNIQKYDSEIKNLELKIEELNKLKEKILSSPEENAFNETSFGLIINDLYSVEYYIDEYNKEINEIITKSQTANTELKKSSEGRSKLFKIYTENFIKDIQESGVKISNSGRALFSNFAESLSRTNIPAEEVEKQLKDFSDSILPSFEIIQKEYQKQIQDLSSTKINAKEFDNFVNNAEKSINDSLKDKIFKGEIDPQVAKNFSEAIALLFQKSEVVLKDIKLKAKDLDAEYLEKQQKAFADFSNEIKKFKDILNELNQNGMSSSVYDNIINNHQELIPYLSDEIELRKKIIETIKNTEEEQKQAYINILSSEGNYYNSKILNNNKLVNEIQEQYNKLFKNLGSTYQLDLNNYKSLAQAKESVEIELIKSLSKKWGDYYDFANDSFTQEWRNFSSVAPASVVESIRKKIDADRKVLKDEQNKWNKFILDTASIDFDKINIDETNKATGGTSASGVDLNEKLILKDRYYSLNQEIEKYNANLLKLEARYKSVNNEEKLKILEKEKELYKQLQIAAHNLAEEQRKERNEVAKALQDYGIEFTGFGDDITAVNAIDVLKNKADEVNKHIKDKNKDTYNKLKSQYESLEQTLKRFFELQDKELPKQAENWWKYQENLNNLKIEQFEVMFDQSSFKSKEFINNLKDVQNLLKGAFTDDLSGVTKQVKLYNDQIAIAQSLIKYWKQEQDKFKDSPEMFQKITEEIQKYEGVIESSTNSIQTLLDKQSESIKKVVKSYTKGLDEIMDTEEKRHKQYLKDLEEEQKAFDDYIDNYKKGLQEAWDLEDYNKDIAEQTEGIAKLQSEIDKYSMAVQSGDLEAIVKIGELNEELIEKKNKLEETQTKHSRDQQIKNLDNLKDTYDKDIQEKKDAENEKYDVMKEIYDKLIKDINNFTDSSTQLTAIMVDTLISDFDNLSAQLSADAAAMANNFRNTFIASLQEAKDEINSLNSLSVGGISNSSNRSSKSSESSESNGMKHHSLLGGGFKNMSDEDFIQYKANKKAYSTADTANQWKLQQSNNAIRQKYGIISDDYGYPDLVNYYAKGTEDVQQLGIVGEKGRELRVLNPNGKDSIIPNGLTENLITLAKNTPNIMNSLINKLTPNIPVFNGGYGNITLNNDFTFTISTKGDFNKSIINEITEQVSKKMILTLNSLGQKK